MLFKNTKLVLDNFRSVLGNYSVDIQDVIRSAILDDVDITDYIQQCSDNPFRLDQIRLGLKEGLPEVYYKFDGDIIYKVRSLRAKGVNTSSLEQQSGYLSDEYIGYLIKWLEDGISVSNLNLTTIPSQLLEVFDYGLRNGFTMKDFNTGIAYEPKYVKLCLKIKKYGRSISALLSGEYSLSVIEILSSSCSAISKESWGNLMQAISPSMSYDKIRYLVEIASYGVDTRRVSDRDEKMLSYIHKSLESKLNIMEDLLKVKDARVMESMLQNATLVKGKTIRGKLRKS